MRTWNGLDYPRIVGAQSAPECIYRDSAAPRCYHLVMATPQWFRGLRLGLLSFAPIYKPRSRSHVHLHYLLRMSSRDVTHLSDISKSRTDQQGAFKRAASTFRNFVQAGGQFPPEKGTCVVVADGPRGTDA
jgi:hypothetical protein